MFAKVADACFSRSRRPPRRARRAGSPPSAGSLSRPPACANARQRLRSHVAHRHRFRTRVLESPLPRGAKPGTTRCSRAGPGGRSRQVRPEAAATGPRVPAAGGAPSPAHSGWGKQGAAASAPAAAPPKGRARHRTAPAREQSSRPGPPAPPGPREQLRLRRLTRGGARASRATWSWGRRQCAEDAASGRRFPRCSPRPAARPPARRALPDRLAAVGAACPAAAPAEPSLPARPPSACSFIYSFLASFLQTPPMDTSPPIPDPGGPRRDFSASEPGPPSFERLLGQLGRRGQRRQHLLLALSCLPCLFLGLGLGSDALFTWIPPRHCWDPNGTRLPKNTTCSQPICQSCDYEGLPALTSNPVTEWSLDRSHSWIIPLEQICFLLGFAAGALFLGYLADSMGRRGTFLLAVALGCPAGILAAFAASPSVFMLGRCLWGVMLGGLQLTLYLSRLELCCPPQRLPVAMAGDLVLVGGQLLLLGLALASRSWRVLQGIMSAGLGVCLLYGCPGLYPESPRWLLATHRTAQAKDVLLSLCQDGSSQESEAQEALDELDNACHLPAAAQISLRALLSCRNIWKNILILGFTTLIAHALCHCYQLACESLEDPQANFYLPFLLSAGSAGLSCVFLCVTVDRYGRRGMLLLTTVLTGIASLILLGLGEYLNSTAKRTFSILGVFTSHAAGALSIFFASEVIPTVIRGKGLGVILALASLGGLSAPLLRLREQHGSFLEHIVLASLNILALLCLMLLPESKRKPLPEGLRDGELYRRPSLLRRARESAGQDAQGLTRRDDVPLLSTPNPAS